VFFSVFLSNYKYCQQRSHHTITASLHYLVKYVEPFRLALVNGPVLLCAILSVVLSSRHAAAVYVTSQLSRSVHHHYVSRQNACETRRILTGLTLTCLNAIYLQYQHHDVCHTVTARVLPTVALIVKLSPEFFRMFLMNRTKLN